MIPYVFIIKSGFHCVTFPKWVVNLYEFAIIMRGNILATENQQAIINDVIDVKIGVYLYKT